MKIKLFKPLPAIFLFLLIGCGEEENVQYIEPECLVDSQLEPSATEQSADRSSEEYQKKFYDSLLGEKDTAEFINPTGTYHFGPYTPKGVDEPIGMQGDVRVIFLKPNHIAVCLAFVSHGPGFNLGYLFDTLELRNNTAVYHPYWDDDCTVTFRFTDDGVDVSQFDEDPGFACEFGMNVYVDGFYKKDSDNTENIDDDCF
jgi:hypothetical protein